MKEARIESLVREQIMPEGEVAVKIVVMKKKKKIFKNIVIVIDFSHITLLSITKHKVKQTF